jgi:acetyl esterase/lipase
MVSGGWVSVWAPPEQMVKFFEPFLNEGYTVMAVRHGSSPRYIIPEITDDVRQALTYIVDHAEGLKVDPKRLGVFGFSAGGHLSLMLGTVGGKAKNGDEENLPRVAAVAAIFPPTELGPFVDFKSPYRERFPALKFEPERADEFSPLKQVTSDDSPVLLVHGDKDELVPIWHSEKIRDALEAAKVPNRLVVIEGAAHGFDAEGNKRMFTNMVEWFNKYLAAK